MAAPGVKQFTCCPVPGDPTQQLDGLSCRFDDHSVEAYVEGGSVRCTPPAAELLFQDAERQGVRMQVTAYAAAATDREQLQSLYDEYLDRATFEEHSALAASGKDSDASAPAPVERQQTMSQRYSALKPFVIISVSYLLFTITDGAIRMIVLLHAYQKGFSAMQVAIMFSFYELAGVGTNLVAGMMGAKWGIKSTLLTGLSLQLVGIGMLFGWQDDWTKTQAILYVTAAQLMCGIAKDLTKLGGKTVTKLVTPDEKQGSLFKLVSFITGFKNSLKGAGYFLGAATVGVNYYMSLGILMGLILAAMPWAILSLSNQLGRARSKNVRFSQLFQNTHNINFLSLSRVFLFGARDVWFEVPLPFFLRDPASGLGWSRSLTGAFLAIWIIVYGQMQSWTPQLILGPLRQSPPNKWVAALWCAILTAVPLSLGVVMLAGDTFGPGVPEGPAAAAITIVLYAFCLVFAVNSAVHSYLIVAYASGDKVAQTVGVYYASNAVGRLVGTLSSGALYSYVGSSIVDGFGTCLMVSVLFAGISSVVDLFLHDSINSTGSRLGRMGGGTSVGKLNDGVELAPQPAAGKPVPVTE